MSNQSPNNVQTGIALPRVLRRDVVLQQIGVSRSTLWRWFKAGEFPGPIRLGPGRVGWRADEVAAWIESRERA